jgi:glycosyltransferase involved in cell wall biosynthesis
MKILYITAGAAGMYCGSCLLDNALAAEMMAQHHEVILQPVYTPTLTDVENVSQNRVFFSGISIYLEQHLPLFRKTPWLVDRIWESTWLLKIFSGRGISPDPTLLGGLTVSMLKGELGNFKKEFQKLADWLRTEPAPDIIHLPNSLLISMAKPIREVLRRPICCTIQGEDLFISRLQERFQQQSVDLISQQVQFVDAFLFSTHSYAEQMCRLFSIPQNKVFIVPFGINLSSFSGMGRTLSSLFTVGFFARIAPEKGLHVLSAAYCHLRQKGLLPESRLLAGGYLGPEHGNYLNHIVDTLSQAGLSEEFHYHGAVGITAKANFYRQLDVFSLPATYDEPKGLSALEAMASGVPVVLPRRGAFIEMIEKTSGGLLFDPEDQDSLAQAIHRVYSDRAMAQALAVTGLKGVREHYSITRMAQNVVEVYRSLAGN